MAGTGFPSWPRVSQGQCNSFNLVPLVIPRAAFTQIESIPLFFFPGGLTRFGSFVNRTSPKLTHQMPGLCAELQGKYFESGRDLRAAQFLE